MSNGIQSIRSRAGAVLAAVVAVFGGLLLPAVSAAGEVVDYGPFEETLRAHVDENGDVDYAALAEDEKAASKLDAFVESIAEAEVEGHGRAARLAFYLNAYNATVLDEIADRWPVDSPRDIDGFFDEIEHRIAGRKMTLDELEHGLIREEFDEPRIHFVLVCAAEACPRLRREV
ncbi:MAG: DUF547 domain-containing protein, partial [Bradymonadaceae bacterium]